MRCMSIKSYHKKAIWQRNLPIIVFLTSCIPKGKLDVLPVYFDVRYIVLEDGGNVDLEMKRWSTKRQCSTKITSDE